MKKQLLLTCLITLSTLFSVAQKDTAYIYTFGGENDEQGRDIELTSDSGFIMVGSTSSFGAGNSDIYLVKVDSNINYEWSAAIGHEFTEFGHAVKQTADNGYIICGYTNSIGNGSYDAYLVRTDDKGKLLWEKTFGGFEWDFAYDLEITADGGFLIVGETHSLGNGNADAYLIKTDKDGNLLWEKTMGGTGKDIAHALIATKDGNFAFCGENASKNPENKGDAWLVKFDGKGDTLFNVVDVSTAETVCYDLVQSLKDNYTLTGYSTKYNDPIEDLNTIQFDSLGSKNWEKGHGGIFIGSDNENDRGLAISHIENNEFWTSGCTQSFGSKVSKDMYLMKLNAEGVYIRGTTYGNNDLDIAHELIWLGNESFILFGESNSYYGKMSSFVLIKFEQFKASYPEVIDSTQDTQKPVLNSIEEQNETILIKTFPNPTDNSFEVEGISNLAHFAIRMFDNIGREVEFLIEDQLININHLQTGQYILELTNSQKKIRLKVFKN